MHSANSFPAAHPVLLKATMDEKASLLNPSQQRNHRERERGKERERESGRRERAELEGERETASKTKTVCAMCELKT